MDAAELQEDGATYTSMQKRDERRWGLADRDENGGRCLFYVCTYIIIFLQVTILVAHMLAYQFIYIAIIINF